MDVVIYDDAVEVQRVRLNPAEGKYGAQLPVGTWHTVEVYEPSTIFEAKDGVFEEVSLEERYALCEQIRRASVSVPSNITEGMSRFSNKEKTKESNVRLNNG